MSWEIVMIIIGFILLICGANLLIKGAVNIAKKFNIPEILIGLTVVALGTSVPELIVTITSASKGVGKLILGNTIGSNLCNLLLILGLMAILRPIEIDKETKKIHIPVLLIVTNLVLLMGASLTIDRIEGMVLLILFMIYFSYPIIKQIKTLDKNFIIKQETKRNKKNVGTNEKLLQKKKCSTNIVRADSPTVYALSVAHKFAQLTDGRQQNNNIYISIIYILISIILLKYGGDFVVNYSIGLARTFNINEEIIGITIIAFGTSLPELVTSMFAILKKDNDLAVGNLVGSCILNLVLILGIGAIINPLSFSREFIQNIIVLLGTNLIIWLFCFMGKKDTITRIKGFFLVIIFLLNISIWF